MTTSAREALATGDVRALVESVGPDEDWTDGEGYLARIGRTNIMIAPDGDVGLHTHDTEEEAVECLRGKVAQLTALADAMAQGPAGILAALQGLLGAQPDPGEATVPLPAVGRASVPGIREVSNEDPTATPPPTGLYL